jgi:hypothetical protein
LHERRTLRSTAHEQHVVVVETPCRTSKVCSIHFHRDGSLFVLFPYFSRTDGFVSVVTRQPGTARLNYLSGAAITSHQVKFSHHPDGRVHFSQTGKIRTSVGKQSIPLAKLHGPAFVLRCQGLHAFEALTDGDRGRKTGRRVVLGAQLSGHVDAVDLIGHWYTKQELLRRTGERVLGPMVSLRRQDGSTGEGALIGPMPYSPPRDRVILLTCQAARSVPNQDSSLLFLGGFDAPFSFHEHSAAFSFLMLAYPRGAVEAVHDLLPSVDL